MKARLSPAVQRLRKTPPGWRCAAFSLAEVVIALGIVSFALLAILGFFGGIIRTSGDNAQRRDLTEVVDSLRTTLNDTSFTTDFTTLCQWAVNKKELLYVTYQTSSNGDPVTVTSGTNTVIGKWLNPDDATTKDQLANYDKARTGPWIRARLSVSPSNPGGTTPPSPDKPFPQASLFVITDIYPVPSHNQAISNQLSANSPHFQTTIVVRR